MTFSLKVVGYAGCMVLAACSADHTRHVVDAGEGVTDGDDASEGVPIDSNGDGVSDGVDTDGDGIIDQPLPGIDGGVLLLDASAPYPMDDAGSVLCGAAPCACSDGLDNDMDGVLDLLDPECVSTWDNDEGSLATGIPGDNRDEACQDCFFDGNSGSGNDGCRLPTSCITLGNASSGHGSCNKCEQSEQCQKFCEAYTPNGCDCFGCCDVRLGGTVKHVLLTAACNITGETLENCTECVPSTTCVNECGKCELCPGKTVADLPAECFSQPPADAGTPTGVDAGTPPPAYTCDEGQQVCGSGQPVCGQGQLCQFGCCTLSPIVF